MKKFIGLFILLTLISGCVVPWKIFSADSKFAPKPYRMGSPPKDANPDYLEGWNDGCETGLSTMNHSYYKSFYKFKQDPYKLNNERYYKAWRDSYHYCRQYSFRFVWDPLDQDRDSGPLCILCPNDLR